LVINSQEAIEGENFDPDELGKQSIGQEYKTQDQEEPNFGDGP